MRRFPDLSPPLVGALLAGSCLWASFAADPASAAEPSRSSETIEQTRNLPSPFGGIETWRYPSGLVVWFKDMPEAETIYFQAALPVGYHQDPEGREGLAHFVEHMMFTGPDGQTKAEYEKLVEDRGGSTNASTSRYRTQYWLKLPAHEWEFGLDWFYHLLHGKEFVPEATVEERRAVLLEKDLKPRRPEDLMRDWVLEPDWKRLPGFWERYFGIEVETRWPRWGTWETIHDASTEDLQAFYERWYGPQNLSIGIFGPLDRERVKEVVDETFGRMPARGEEPVIRRRADPRHGPHQTVSYRDRGSHYIKFQYLIPDYSREDWLHATFLFRLLHEHLNDILRQERRAAYSVRVGRDLLLGQMVLRVGGSFDKDLYDSSRATIEETIAALRAGEMDAERFEELRQRAVAAYLLGHETPADLARWVRGIMYRRDILGTDFVDPPGFMNATGQDELAAWMQERIREDLLLVQITRAQPLWATGEGLLVLLTVLLTYSLSRWLLVRPLDLTSLVYLRKIHYGPLQLLGGGLVLFLAIVLLGNLFDLGTDLLHRWLIAPWDSYPLHLASELTGIAAVIFLLLLVPAQIPRKILLLREGWRLKYWTFRSRPWAYDDILEARRCHLLGVLFTGRIFFCRILHWGLLRRGIYLRVGRRRGYFFRTRNDRELLSQIEGMRGAPMERGSQESPRPGSAIDIGSSPP